MLLSASWLQLKRIRKRLLFFIQRKGKASKEARKYCPIFTYKGGFDLSEIRNLESFFKIVFRMVFFSSVIF